MHIAVKISLDNHIPVSLIMIQNNDVILFQGDSITDGGRDRNIKEANDRSGLGLGYAHHSAATMLVDSPLSALTIYNRGIGGNRITDLAERWAQDSIELKPNLLSILIGVNDTWHERNNPGQGVPVDKFDRVYRTLLDETLKTLPGVRLVIGEPFALRCGAVNDSWYPEFTERQAVVAAIAQDYSTKYIPYQEIFDNASRDTGPDYWTLDGVHPTTAGHLLMARAWIDVVIGGAGDPD